MSTQFGKNDFAPHLHTIFRVETPMALELEMVELKDKSNAHVEQFALLFTGPASPWLPQGTYTLLHPEMGELSLFMGPKGPREALMTYEVVFSRLIAGGGARPGLRLPIEPEG